jgi:2-polyprenyl-3-methyl-5-hydroxy-6-metoxy-1,4-benzoquinol methylase
VERVDHIYHDYSQPDPPHQPLYLATMLRHLRASGDIKDVLDIGCGDGNFTASLADAGFAMHGLDPSAGGVARAQERYPNIQFRESSAYDDLLKPFGRTEPFDAIVTIEVIEHLYSPRTLCRRVREALRPGGLFIVTTPYWGYLKNVGLALTNRVDRALTALWEGGHIKHFSYQTLRRLGEEQGLTFVAFEGAGRPIPFLWKGMLMVFRRPSDS